MIRLVINSEDDRILPRLTSWHLNERQDKLTFNALREGDPYFSEFLDTVLVEEDKTEELVLEGSVREIILEEWDAYYTLVTWMSEVGEPYMTVEMAILLRRSRQGLPFYDHNYIHYVEIEKIHRMLNMPKYWELCVNNSYDDLQLYETVGRQVVELLSDYYPLIRQGHDNTEYDPENGQSPLYLVAHMIDQTPKDVRDITTVALYGILHSSILTILEYNRLNPDPEYHTRLNVVSWKSALAILKNHNTLGKNPGHNTLATLAGEGTLNMETVPLVYRYWKRNGPMYEYTLPVVDVEFIYNTCLSMFPEDVDRKVFGLAGGIVTPIENAIARVIPYRHIFLLSSIEAYAKNIGWNLDKKYEKRIIKANASLFYNRIGREGTRHALLSLLHSEARGEANTSKDYANELERLLEEGSEINVIPYRDESTLVQYLLWITQKK